MHTVYLVSLYTGCYSVQVDNTLRELQLLVSLQQSLNETVATAYGL